MKYIKGFDTIRALAVCLVIMEHWGPLIKPSGVTAGILNLFFHYGAFGVVLFFVLSGFLITNILLYEKDRIKENQYLPVIKNFFVRRVLRIFPIYYLFIFTCYACNFPAVREHIGYLLTYTSNILLYNSVYVLSHTWSLAVEEQFYLVWPWLIILVKRKYLKYVFLSAIVIGIVSKYMALFVYHHEYASLVINCFDSFGIGALYAYVRRDEALTHRFEREFKIVLPALLFLAWRVALFSGFPLVYIYDKTLDSVIGVALIMFVLNNKNLWVKKYILENRVLNFIGKISYGIYLYHFALGPVYDDFVSGHAALLPGFMANGYVNFGLKFVLLIGVCWLSFKLIEQPILRLKKRFAYV